MTDISRIYNSIPKKLFHLIIGIILGFSCLVTVRRSVAQDIQGSWSSPVNLSHSGAASQPRIVATPDGKSQVFWWDRFDGLTTAIFDGITWSESQQAPIRSESLHSTPYIVIDSNSLLHAFWLEPVIENENQRELMYSQMLFGSTQWTFPENIAESAVAFDIATSASGVVDLAYIRTLDTPETPAGVYFKKNLGNGIAWAPSIPIKTSNYFRLLTPDTAHVRIAASETNETLYLVWEESARYGSQFVVSFDGGSSWSSTAVQILGSQQEPASYPRVVALPDDEGALLLWESVQGSGCTIYQRHLDFNNQEDLTQLDDLTLGNPIQVMNDLISCPRGDRFVPLVDEVLWLWGQGTDELTISAWRSDPGDWTLPLHFEFNFEDTETGELVSLNELQAAISEDQLAVIGKDQVTGEVWATEGQASALDLVNAPPPLWTPPIRVSQERSINGLPVIGIDQQGFVNIIWSETSGQDESLLFVRSLLGITTTPIVITQASQGGLARQPSLMLENLPENNDLLHLVWSGGNKHQIFYSRTLASNATAGGWITPQPLSKQNPASWPQIVSDPSGRLYVIYVITLNEERGVYLVYSDDKGENWSNPIQVFDAVQAGYDMVDHPTLSIGPDGGLHVAWVEMPLPGMGMPRNIFYSHSIDGGHTWSKPFLVTGLGYDWPRLSVTNGQIHALFLRPDSGGVFHRWSVVEPDGEIINWSIIVGVPGCRDTQALFGTTATRQKLHLVCSSTSSVKPFYSFWEVVDIDKGSWSKPEAISPQSFGIVRAEEGLLTDLGASVAVQAQRGELAVTWLEPSNLQSSVRANQPLTQSAEQLTIFLSSRAIPSETTPPISSINPTLSPLATPTVSVSTQASLIATPTATPELSSMPPPSSDSNQPLFIGIGFTVIVVGCIFAGWILWRRGRLGGG